MRTVFAFCLFLSSGSFFLPAAAQQLPPILTTKQYVAGIYLNYSEFLNNTPSVTRNFSIKTNAGLKKIEKGISDYKLILLDSLRGDPHENFWGASDGVNIFINEQPYTSKRNLKQIQGIGRYCYFRASTVYNLVTTMMTSGAIGVAATTLEPDWAYILNINNGKVFQLDKSLLRMILKKDNELLTQYEAERRNGSYDVMFSYIGKYSAKHIAEAYLDKFDPIEVIFYRTGKKQLAESFTVEINDSISMRMDKNAFHRYYSNALVLNLCINEICQNVELIKKRIHYMNCNWTDVEEQPDVAQVEKKAGEFYSRIAESRKKQENGEPEKD